jgi:integrase
MAHSAIHGIFEEAIDDSIVHANPSKGLLRKILPPKNRRNIKEADSFSMEERDLFIKSAEQKLTPSEALILKVMVHAGFRLGEALAMRFRHLDFNKMTYQVRETYKQCRFSKTKTGKKRLVDLPEFLVSELKSYILYLRQENLKNGIKDEVDLLFRDPKEGGDWPFSQRKIQDIMKKVCKGAGLRFRNPHDLRHTYATILLMAHLSPAYVQKQLGHSSISITVDTYGHWISGEGRQGLEKSLLGPERNPG